MDPDLLPSTDNKQMGRSPIRLALAIGIGLAISAYIIGISCRKNPG